MMIILNGFIMHNESGHTTNNDSNQQRDQSVQYLSPTKKIKKNRIWNFFRRHRNRRDPQPPPPPPPPPILSPDQASTSDLEKDVLKKNKQSKTTNQLNFEQRSGRKYRRSSWPANHHYHHSESDEEEECCCCSDPSLCSSQQKKKSISLEMAQMNEKMCREGKSATKSATIIDRGKKKLSNSSPSISSGYLSTPRSSQALCASASSAAASLCQATAGPSTPFQASGCESANMASSCLEGLISSAAKNSITPSVVVSDHSLEKIVHSVIRLDLDCFNVNDCDDATSYLINTDIRRDSVSSNCSSTSSLSSLGEDDFWSEDQIVMSNSFQSTLTTKPASAQWRKVKSLVTSPFIQTYKRQKYPWIQLAGHQGNFLSGHFQGTILKKLSGNEHKCFEKLMSDQVLCKIVPRFKQMIYENDQVYLELEDLLAKFIDPSVMDIKMGIRTYLEEEITKANEKVKFRKDMYEKMVAIDPNEPKPEEHAMKAITKPRYMTWRETISSTSTLGFRIDGMKLSTGGSIFHKDLKRIKFEEAVRESINQFTGGKLECITKYLTKLRKIRTDLENSEFFHSHEMIGSSLLFVHDENNADIWLIDFAKTYPLPENISINHRDLWQLGNHEDGYLFGLDNLIKIFLSLKEAKERS